MAEETIDKTPSEKEEEKPNFAEAIGKNLAKGAKVVKGEEEPEEPEVELATASEYNAMMADRPEKFSAAQVKFQDPSPYDHSCGGCFHYFTGVVAKRNTCEIYRPEGEESVPASGVCRFWTLDGVKFPILSGKEEKEK